MTLNHEPVAVEVVPVDLPDDTLAEPERFRVYADQRNPDLGSALLWGTIALMGLAAWGLIALVLS